MSVTNSVADLLEKNYTIKLHYNSAQEKKSIRATLYSVSQKRGALDFDHFL